MDGSFKAWEPMDDLVLQGCWRSSTSHHHQIALHLKQVPFHYAPVTFDAGMQHSTACLTINANVKLPTQTVHGAPGSSPHASSKNSLEPRDSGLGMSLIHADPRKVRRCRELGEASPAPDFMAQNWLGSPRV